MRFAQLQEATVIIIIKPIARLLDENTTHF